ncbi:porin [Colwellia sp. RE-S-Sl-9]
MEKCEGFRMKKMKYMVVVPLLLASYSSHADFTWNGFASIGAGVTMDEDEVFVIDELTGARYTDELSFKPDTLFALQVSSDLGDDLSVTAQLLGNGGNDFDMEFEWAYLSYNINSELTFQVGRLRTPFFVHSLSLDVGYTYNWIRPPSEFNTVSDLSKRIEGVDLTWSKTLGDFDTTFSLTYGNSEVDAIISLGPSNLKFKDVTGLTGQVTYDWLTVRAGYLEADAEVTPESSGVTLPINAGYQIYTVAAIAEWDQYSIKSEYFQRNFPGNAGNDDTGWYLSGAYTIGDFTPHITFSTFKDNDTNSNPLALEKYNSTIVGVKYNFHSNAALKLEYISRSVDTTEEAASALIARGGIPIVEADVLAVAVDLIF